MPRNFQIYFSYPTLIYTKLPPRWCLTFK